MSPPVSAKYARAGQNLQLPALEGSLESQLTRSTVTVRPCVTSGWSVRRWWQAAGHNQEKQSFFLRVKALGRWRDEEAQSQATSAAAALRAEGLERLWEGLLASCVFHILQKGWSEKPVFVCLVPATGVRTPIISVNCCDLVALAGELFSEKDRPVFLIKRQILRLRNVTEISQSKEEPGPHPASEFRNPNSRFHTGLPLGLLETPAPRLGGRNGGRQSV